jgi:hypothetical protein
MHGGCCRWKFIEGGTPGLLPAKWAEYTEDMYEEVAEEKAEYALTQSDCGIEQGWVGYMAM